MSQMVSRGLQASFTGLMLLHDQDDKAWCHGGHGRSCSPYVNIVLTDLTHRHRACYGGFNEGLWRANFSIVLVTRQTFPKGCHLLGDERQAGTSTITAVPIYRC